MKANVSKQSEAKRIAKEREKIAEVQTVGGHYCIFCNDGCSGPYTVLGIFAGGSGWHWFAEFRDYRDALDAVVTEVKEAVGIG